MGTIWDEVAVRLEGAAASGGSPLAMGDVDRIRTLLEHELASPDPAGLREAARALEAGLRTLLANADPDLRAALRDGSSSPMLQAYLLGQVAMAQSLAGHAGSVRVDAGFAGRLAGSPLARLLSDAERDRDDLAASLGKTAEEIGELLAAMVAEGSVDHRMSGRRRVYFLTPPARAVMGRAA